MYSCNQAQEDGARTDSLLLQADTSMYSNCFKSLEYAKQASLIAEKAKDSKRKTEAYYYIAYNLYILEDYEKSNSYIEKGLAEYFCKIDELIKARFLALKGFQYSRLHLHKQEAQHQRLALKLIMQRNDPESIMTAARSFASIGGAYTLNNDYVRALQYNARGIELANTVSEKAYKRLKEIHKVKAQIFYLRAMTFIEQFRTNEALPFIQQAFLQAQTDGKPPTLYLELYGDYYSQIGDIPKAISYYLDALAEKQKRIWNRSTSADLTMKISMSYGKIKLFKEEQKYLKLSAAARLIDENKNRTRVQAVLDNIEKEEKLTRVKEKQVKVIFTFLFFLAFLISIWKYKKIILNKKKIISAKETEMEQKKQLIETLERKVNESFSDLIQLAKNNSPLFWARFQEVHPKFLKRMLCIDANFKTSELILSAYIYMGFSTKEIADYTFKATKTIENNRYNLRKKLGLSPEEDLNLWLRNQVDDNQPTSS